MHSFPICTYDPKSMDHLHGNCEVLLCGVRLLARWCNVQIMSFASANYWICCTDLQSFLSAKKTGIDAVILAMMFSSWSFCNVIIFQSPKPRNDRPFDTIVSNSLTWIPSRCRVKKLDWMGWLINHDMFFLSFVIF